MLKECTQQICIYWSPGVEQKIRGGGEVVQKTVRLILSDIAENQGLVSSWIVAMPREMPEIRKKISGEPVMSCWRRMVSDFMVAQGMVETGDETNVI